MSFILLNNYDIVDSAIYFNLDDFPFNDWEYGINRQLDKN